MSNELQHWGIKGMKWGVRRYQNNDGSLTPAGRKRYSDYDGGKDSVVRKTIPVGDGKRKSSSAEDYQNAIKKTKAAGEAIDNVRKFNDDTKKLKDPAMERRIRKSTEQMSDKELQQRVQRLNMEDNYTRMMMYREQLERGESFVNKALDVSSTALKGAATALTIAVALKELKKKS